MCRLEWFFSLAKLTFLLGICTVYYNSTHHNHLKSAMQAELKNNPITFTSLESLLKLTPLLTAATLAISITYDSAYLWALGLSMSDIPSSISEHIRSTLLWCPMILFLLMTTFVLVNIAERPKKNTNIKREVKFNKYQKFVLLAILAIVIMGDLYIIFYKNEKAFIFLLVALVWIILVAILFANTKKISHPFLVYMFLTLPLILSFFGFTGYIAGRKILNISHPQWEYIIKKNDEEIHLNVNAQRRFTEFTIAVLPEKKILIIQNSNIVSMKSL